MMITHENIKPTRRVSSSINIVNNQITKMNTRGRKNTFKTTRKNLTAIY